MNEQTRNAIEMAYSADVAGMQSAIEDLVKTKVLDALEGKKQEVAKELMNNTNEEKCCDELSPKQKKEMDVDDDEDIDEKDLKALRKKKLKEEEVEDLEEISSEKAKKYYDSSYKDWRKRLNTRVVPKGEREDMKRNVKNREKGMDSAFKIMTRNIEEKLSPSMGVDQYIHDFVHSDNPKFEGKSKKERIKQAIAAYYSAKKGN